MKKLLILVVFLTWHAAGAQIRDHKQQLATKFFQFRQAIPPSRFIRSAATMRLLPSFGRPSLLYWEGLSYTSYSENGRIRSTHSFDVQGQFRETRTSFALKKNGVLSNWRIQVSSQRTRPLFVFILP
mgnify:FL=1